MRKSDYKKEKTAHTWLMEILWDKGYICAKPREYKWLKKYLSRKYRRNKKTTIKERRLLWQDMMVGQKKI